MEFVQHRPAVQVEDNIVDDRSKQRWIIISVAFAAFMARLDSSIVNISLPTISHYFSTGTGDASWIILSYLLMQTATMLLSGKIADTIGLRKTFAVGYLIFIGGSLFCAVSPTLALLVGSRCLQGVGTALMTASGYAIISTYLPGTMTGTVFGVASTTAGFGLIFGAPLGGLITGTLSWHWIFLINIPVGIIAVLISFRVIPDAAKPAVDGRGGDRFDLSGSLLSFAGLLGLTFALNRGRDWGWSSFPIVGILAGSSFVLTGFYLRERNCPNPVLDLRLLRDRRLLFTTTASFICFMIMGGTNFLLPFYLEMAKGLRTEHAGFVLSAYSLTYMGMGLFAGRISDKFSPVALCSMAMISTAACCWTFSFTLGYPGLSYTLLFLVWLALSFGLFISPNNSQTMRFAPEHEKGVTSGVLNTMNSLGLVFGVSIFETIFAGAMPADRISSIAGSVGQGLSGQGFQEAFIVAGFAAGVGVVFSALVRSARKHRRIS